MLFTDYKWLDDFMDITPLSFGFEVFILVAAVATFALSYSSEKVFFPRLAKGFGLLKMKLRPKSAKTKKRYKVIAEAAFSVG